MSRVYESKGILPSLPEPDELESRRVLLRRSRLSTTSEERFAYQLTLAVEYRLTLPLAMRTIPISMQLQVRNATRRKG